jgi:O-antigen/teichoic acid export membrane protein
MFVNITYYVLLILLDNLFELNLVLVFKIILIEYSIFIITIFILSPISFSENKKSNNSFQDYYRYCLPIAPMLFFGGFVKVLEPWLINFFGDSEQQAYYSISLQFTMILVLALSSIINIFWKEIAESIEEGKFDRVSLLYLRSARYLLLFMTVGSFFLFFQTSNIINLFLGLEYSNAIIPMQILFLYPCLQVFGQLNNVMFLANESTKTYAKYSFFHIFLSMLTSIIGLSIITNLVSSPMSIASFMAFKLLFIDFLFMLITTKEISKIFKIYSGFNFMYLIPTVICFYAFIIFQITQLFIPLDMFISNILLNAAIYLMFFIYMFLKHPGALFISKEDSLFLRKKLKL